MRDAWHAECGPCKWLELYDTEDSAIKAAEIHVLHFHADVHPILRGEARMGHVQNRTVDEVAIAGGESDQLEVG